MGKVLKVLGVVFLLIVVGIVALLVWAHHEGGKEMDRFFGAIETGDPQKVLDLMAPSLTDEIDPPVLKLWMKAVNERLGKFDGLSAGSFGTETETTDAGQKTETHGTAKFEKGEAEVRLVLLDDKIVGFQVSSDKLDDETWFIEPDTDLYKERSKAFIKHLIAGEAEPALAMMHANLGKQFTADQLKQAMAQFVDLRGPLKEIEFTGETVGEDADSKFLTLTMTCICEKETVPAYTTFRFVGFKGHLAAFGLPGEPD